MEFLSDTLLEETQPVVIRNTNSKNEINGYEKHFLEFSHSFVSDEMLNLIDFGVESSTTFLLLPIENLNEEIGTLVPGKYEFEGRGN